MPESTSKRVVQGEDIIILIDDKPTLHATTHSLKVDLELKETRQGRAQIACIGPDEDLLGRGIYHLFFSLNSRRGQFDLQLLTLGQRGSDPGHQ